MDKKSFLWGILAGIVLTIVTLLVIGYAIYSNEEDDPIEYLEKPVSYENKSETSFKVIQVLGNAALANEISDKKYNWYYGNTVLILGDNYYTDQIVKVKNPQRVGTYSYTSKGDRPMTVPVINGDMN